MEGLAGFAVGAVSQGHLGLCERVGRYLRLISGPLDKKEGRSRAHSWAIR